MQYLEKFKYTFLTIKEALEHEVPFEYLRVPDNRNKEDKNLYIPFELKKLVHGAIIRIGVKDSSGEDYYVRYAEEDFIFSTLSPEEIRILFILKRVEDILKVERGLMTEKQKENLRQFKKDLEEKINC